MFWPVAVTVSRPVTFQVPLSVTAPPDVTVKPPVAVVAPRSVAPASRTVTLVPVSTRVPNVEPAWSSVMALAPAAIVVVPVIARLPLSVTAPVVVRLKVPVTVLAKDGRPVGNLGPQDFKLFDNGVEQKFDDPDEFTEAAIGADLPLLPGFQIP